MVQLLYAVAFGKSETDGNDGFFADLFTIQTTNDSTFSEVFEEYKATCLAEGGIAYTPAGFWLLTVENLSISKIPFDNGRVLDDAYIQANKISKRICKRLATKTLYV